MIDGNPVPRQTETRLAYALLAAVVVVWGGSNVAGKYVVGDIPPFTVGLVRVVLALAALAFILVRQEGLVLPQRRDWPMISALGLLGIFGCNATFYTAMQYTSVTNAGLIIAGSPIVITLLSAFMLRERISLWQITGIILSFSGVAVVITKGSWSVLVSQGLNIGDLIMLGNPICLGLYTVLIKKLLDRYSPLAVGTYAHFTGIIYFVPFVIYELVTTPSGIHVSVIDVGALLYVGILASCLGTLWWNKGIAIIGASRSGVFMNGIPISTMVLSAILLGETIALPQVLGSVMVITGVYLNSMRYRSNGILPVKDQGFHS